MQPVKIIIDGSYWDSQIYSGELILLDAGGALHKINWRQAVDGIASKNNTVQTALRVGFSDSDLFYNPKVRKILMDPQIAVPIKGQLSALSNLSLTADRNEWRKYWETEQSPFKFLPTDTEIYYNQIFAAGNIGLFSSPRPSIGIKKSAPKLKKHHDGKTFQIRASDHHTALAAATGADGLFEFAYHRDDDDVLGQGKILAPRPCKACDWAFQSVMGWTDEGAFMAAFKERKDPRSRQVLREFDRVIEEQEMFGSATDGFSWGSREKMYRISNGEFQVVDYSPQSNQKPNKDGKPKVYKSASEFSQIDNEKIQLDSGGVISTGTAPFGTVIEFDDRISVMRSDGILESFGGEAVHWRIFPRSEHYSNQLHILYEDRIEIISFVHDYFVDQKNKRYGFSRGGSDSLKI
ncbi:MAG: hypothetical protein WAQ08_00385 [Aquabacterium sp.]|jgi:hypothetical protein|uniref:hypothetical protein n=1 Tax=Aquabacterium sp. TaxID=1872578 RepID=UPI003BAFAF6B